MVGGDLYEKQLLVNGYQDLIGNPFFICSQSVSVSVSGSGIVSFFVPRVLPWNVFFLRLQPSSFAFLLSGFCEFMKKGAGAPREDVTREDPRNEEKGFSSFSTFPRRQ